jgi:hypothetical protein
VDAMSRSIAFASTCPSCKRELPQEFVVAVLRRLLQCGCPIEAYCASCDDFWQIDPLKRVELGEAVAAACGGTSEFERT